MWDFWKPPLHPFLLSGLSQPQAISVCFPSIKCIFFLHSCEVSLHSLRPLPPDNHFLSGRLSHVFTGCLQPAQWVLLSALLSCPGLQVDQSCPADRLQSGLLVSQLLSWDTSKLTINKLSWGGGGRFPAWVCMKSSGKGSKQVAVESNKTVFVAPFSHLECLQISLNFIPSWQYCRASDKICLHFSNCSFKCCEEQKTDAGLVSSFLLHSGNSSWPWYGQILPRTNESSHSYLIHKCMALTCVVAGFHPCYSYLPPTSMPVALICTYIAYN